METPVTRRTQFSSCDECRRSRVACDASTSTTLDGQPGSCTRCRNRGRSCTFKWLQSTKKPASKQNGVARRRGHRRNATSRASETPSTQTCIDPDNAVNIHAAPESPGNGRREEPVTPAHSLLPANSTHCLPTPPIPNDQERDLPSQDTLIWLQNLYREGFEAVFGSWMGRYSCPFLFGREKIADKYVSISDMCCHLDQSMEESNDSTTVHDTEAQVRTKNHQIQESLRNTIAAFSARWLPITSCGSAKIDHSALIQTLWRRARRDMLRIINRPSYRSMLSLFLFALTPIPAGINEDEEADGISGLSCVHAALQQIQALRARQRNLQFSGSKVSPSFKTREAVCTTPGSMDTGGFINGESIAYWAALTFDTSASLTLNLRPLLSSGLLGFDSELPWQLVRTTSRVFAETARQWEQGDSSMTDERANQIIAAAASWKLLGWKLTAIFKEALRDGHDESEIRKAFVNVLESTKEFNAIYRHPLDECHRRMQFLGQKTKLRWFSLMLHYHLSILMLADVIEVTDRHDLLGDLGAINSDAENTVMNALVFGLHNSITFTRHDGPTNSGSLNTSKELTFKVPIISIDPYPHHIVAGVQLVRKSIDRDFEVGKLTGETYYDLLSTLERTLEHLPQSSKSVQAARARFVSSLPGDAGSANRNPFATLNFPV